MSLAEGRNGFWKPKLCHVGTYLIALAEYTQMRPEIQSFFRF